MGDCFFNYTTPEFHTTNVISLVCASLVFFYILWLKITNLLFASRVTLNLQLAIAFVDILRHLNNIFNYSEDRTACSFLGFFFYYLFHVNTYLNFAFAINLHQKFLIKTMPSERFTHALYILPFVVPLAIDLIPLALGAYGVGLTSFCFFKAGGEYYEAAKTLVLYITNYPFMIYCFCIPVAILLKVSRTQPSTNPTELESQLLIGVKSPTSKPFVYRVSLYPLACFMCNIGCAIGDVYISIWGECPKFLVSWTFLGLSSNGLINMLFLLLDPFVIETVNPPKLLMDSPDEPKEKDAEVHRFDKLKEVVGMYQFKN